MIKEVETLASLNDFGKAALEGIVANQFFDNSNAYPTGKYSSLSPYTSPSAPIDLGLGGTVHEKLTDVSKKRPGVENIVKNIPFSGLVESVLDITPAGKALSNYVHGTKTSSQDVKYTNFHDYKQHIKEMGGF